MKSWTTIFGSPLVPDVKYISIESVFLLRRSSVRTYGLAVATPRWKSYHPSGTSGPMEMRNCNDGDVGRAAAMCFVMSSSPQAMTARMPAALQRYVMSAPVSRCVAGMTMAPSLCRATMQYHHSMRRFRMSMTRVPRSMPRSCR